MNDKPNPEKNADQKPFDWGFAIDSRITGPSRVATARAAEKAFKAAWPPIDAKGLASLVLASNKGKPDADEKQIDSVIELVAKCQLRLALAHEVWGGRFARFWEETFQQTPPSEKQKSILAIEGPISFDRGLILMGVSDRPKPKGTKTTNADRRAKNYFEWFARDYISSSRNSHVYSPKPGQRAGEVYAAGRIEDWKKPSDSEVRDAYEEKKLRGWPERQELIIDCGHFEQWRKWKTSENNKLKAKKSAAVRRKSSKLKRNK